MSIIFVAICAAIAGIDEWVGMHDYCEVNFDSSLEPSAEQLSQEVRAHWEVENKVHWVLDLTYNEDRSKIYKDNGPEIMNMARKLGLNLVNHARGKLSVRRMQNKAKMSAEYLFKLISQEN